jgi:tripartite-type tricarboxylate transporter receptor subunit TctC
MKLPRRKFLQLAAGAAALPAASHVTWAQTYPTRPVRIITGFAPGGAVDVVARLIGQWLSERLGQQFIVDNRPGAASNMGAEAVAHAPPDGYTLFLVTVVNAINASVYDNLNFDLMRDLAPVAGLTRGPSVMEVNPELPAKSVPEFIAFAKANPAKINMATAGSGSVPNVYGKLFEMMTGVEMIAVPYGGTGAALPDLMSGRVQVMFEPVASSIGYIRAGKLRPLAVTTATRAAALPDIPTVGEFVPGYEASGWTGLVAPRSTPPQIIETLNKEVNEALADTKMKTRLADLGVAMLALSPADFGKFIADEIEKWAKVIKFAGIKPD